MFRGWHFRAPSAHPRDPESDSFLACAVKKTERGWGRRARDDACRRSRLLSSVFVSSISYKKNKNNAWSPMGPKLVCCHRIESNLIQKDEVDLFYFFQKMSWIHFFSSKKLKTCPYIIRVHRRPQWLGRLSSCLLKSISRVQFSPSAHTRRDFFLQKK